MLAFIMPKNLDKFFDPETLPEKSKVEVSITYFKVIRTKLRLPFTLPQSLEKEYAWDYPLADAVLEDCISKGGDTVLVDGKLYNEKVKALANL